MLSAYSIVQMKKALQQPPIMAALIDAQDRVRRYACGFCIAASSLVKSKTHKALSHVRMMQWLHDAPSQTLP